MKRDTGSKDIKVRSLLESGEDKIRERKLKDAVEDLLEAAALDPENPEVHYRLGIAYVRMERYEQAVRHLVKLISSDLSYINRVHARMILGYVYTLKEDYVKALEHLRWIIKAGFNSAQAYAAIGYIMDRLGNFKEAVMNLYRAVEIDPDNANAHNSLGYIYAEAGVNLEQALVECRKAVGIDGSNPAYLDSLGWVCYKLGKYSQAKSYLTKALKKSPGNEEIMRHLALVTDEGKPAGQKRPPHEVNPAGRRKPPNAAKPGSSPPGR
jgi:Flp pilus assembly protein TadD